LRYFLIILILLLSGCENNNSHKVVIQKQKAETKTNTKIETEKELLKLPTLVFKEKNGKISYETNTTNILLFVDNSNLSLAQQEELNRSKRKFYIIKNIKLLNYFDVKKFPTIIILDKNKTKKYEGFVPNEVLKYELKD